MLVAVTGNNRIQVLHPGAGSFEPLARPQGILPAVELSGPEGIVASGDYVFVADTGHNRVIQLDKSGRPIREWGRVDQQPGDGRGEFNHPVGVAVDHADNLIVADTYNHRVQMLLSDGRVFIWGAQGNGPGQLLFPTGIAIDDSDNVYITDSGNDRIQKLLATPG